MSGRYAAQPHLQVPQGDGTVRPLSTPRVSVGSQADVVYPVRAGDRLDLLSAAALGDSTRWWALADANPEADALALERPGTLLAVPGA